MAHRGQVVDLVGLHLVDQVDQPDPVGHVTEVQEEPRLGVVRVLVDGVDPARVEGGRPTHQTVDLVALGEQQLGQVGPVLPRDPRDQGLLHHRHIALSGIRHVLP